MGRSVVRSVMVVGLLRRAALRREEMRQHTSCGGNRLQPMLSHGRRTLPMPMLYIALGTTDHRATSATCSTDAFGMSPSWDRGTLRLSPSYNKTRAIQSELWASVWRV